MTIVLDPGYEMHRRLRSWSVMTVDDDIYARIKPDCVAVKYSDRDGRAGTRRNTNGFG